MQYIMSPGQIKMLQYFEHSIMVFYLAECVLSLYNTAYVVNFVLESESARAVLVLVKYVLGESIIQMQSLISLLSLSHEMSLSLQPEIPALGSV